MKIRIDTNLLAPPGLLAGAALFAARCVSSRLSIAEERQFIQLHHVTNTGVELNLKKGDVVAIACAKPGHSPSVALYEAKKEWKQAMGVKHATQLWLRQA